jgi:hypothetical protein
MTGSKSDQLAMGVNCTYLCGIAISDCRDGDTPEKQVERTINALFHEGHAGKPHLIPHAEALLEKYKQHIASGVKADPPKPVPDITRIRR